MRRLAFLVTHAPWMAVYALVFIQKLVIANATVAWEVLTPGLNLRPGIVVVPTRCRTDAQIMMLANTITMTPGTLSLEVDPATREIYVHGLFVGSREKFVNDIHDLERILFASHDMTGFDLALASLSVAFALALVRAVRGPHVSDRALAADLGFYVVVATIAVLSARSGFAQFLDVVLVAVLLGFLATIALGALIGRSGP